MKAIELFLHQSTFIQVCFLVLAISLFIQLLFYFIVYLRPKLWKQKTKAQCSEPVSVIICARNEEDNLRKFLPLVLEQNYPDFEVIVVNDCSQDNTEILLGELEQRYQQLRHTTIELDRKFTHGKKLAVNIGIKSAKNNRLVFIDADCYPVSKNWLKEISNSYTINKQIVLGYGGYEKKKGLLNIIIRFDAFFIAMQYLGMAIAGRPYMGVGRNMSYLKSLYTRGKGFASHYHIQSGDDDLFINEHAQKSNTAVMISAESFTRSVPHSSFTDWAKQKKRHLTTAPFYNKTDKFILSIEPFSRFLFYLMLAVLLWIKAPIVFLGAIFGVRLIVQLTIIKLVMNKFNEKGFWLLTPFMDVFLPIIQLFFIFSNQLNAKYSKWI